MLTPLRAIFLILVLTACQKPTPEPSADTKASTSASTAAGQAGAPGNPCQTVTKQACTLAGAESTTCQAFEVLAEVLAPEACQAELEHFVYTEALLIKTRTDCVTLIERLCGELETETCEMVRQTTAKFPPKQCTDMLKNFDKVLEELKQEEAKNKPVTGELLSALHADNAPSFGPSDAPVTVVEFSDFECPYCARAAAVAQQIKGKYQQVRFVFRHFPLSFHKNARKAHEAALAANSEGKFWEFHDKLFENQKSLEPASLRAFASDVGVTKAAVASALDTEQYAALVQADIELGNKVSVSGTPSLFINGTRVNNPGDFELVSKIIDAKLAQP